MIKKKFISFEDQKIGMSGQLAKYIKTSMKKTLVLKPRVPCSFLRHD